MTDHGDSRERLRAILRDPPSDARRRGLDPDLPVCICGEQVATAHAECRALFTMADGRSTEP